MVAGGKERGGDGWKVVKVGKSEERNDLKVSNVTYRRQKVARRKSG